MREIIKLQLKLLIIKRHLIIITGWFYECNVEIALATGVGSCSYEIAITL